MKTKAAFSGLQIFSDQEAETHTSTSTLRMEGDWGAALGRSDLRVTRQSWEGMTLCAISAEPRGWEQPHILVPSHLG